MKNGYYEELGTKNWYLNDKLHREDGPAVIYVDGTQVWYLNGAKHRLDGPALIGGNGYKAWYLNGKRHREDGPAVIWSNGKQEWWVKNSNITYDVNQWLKEFNLTLTTLEFEDEMALKFFIRGLAT